VTRSDYKRCASEIHAGSCGAAQNAGARANSVYRSTEPQFAEDVGLPQSLALGWSRSKRRRPARAWCV